MTDKHAGERQFCALNQHLDCNTEKFGKPVHGSISTVIRSYKGVVRGYLKSPFVGIKNFRSL
jgi:hypothetical protein